MQRGSNKWISFGIDLKASKPKESVSNGVNGKDQQSARKVKNKTRPNLNLIDKLKPVHVDDLSVHVKKVKEVSTWLEQNVCCDQTGSAILLLTGPTGAGKTATINVLCKSLNISIREWINPIDQEIEGVYTQAQYSRFIEFFSLGKYVSLCQDSMSKQVLLIEDFPNFLIHNPEQFVDVLEKCTERNLSVIFICTDASNSKIDFLQTLFPQEVKEKYFITNINFNPVSATLIKSALKRAQQVIRTFSEEYKSLSADVIDAIVVSAMGDIRSAVNQFMFACLRGVGNIPLELNETTSKKRKRNEKSSAVKFMQRDEILGFFHALGRVLNPKHGDNALKKLEYDFDSLIDQFATQPSNFNAFLQENYLKYFGDLNDVRKAAEIMSTAQSFLANWSERHEIMLYALWIAVLGLMIYNEHKVSKWTQIKGPTKLKQLSNSTEVCDLKRTDYFYYNLITGTNKFHTFKPY
ncbi:hypothetical protein RN001_013847 [Aquatica leii]|uniref:Cell cycle checkpoint protein RAD17 n=1 Tax=Aquatica leii TaxID=1421715 RepID=A0AAN7SCK5_9COLE|nr:hypothetical protein RN001_013847 [Aquatica leii]